MTSSKARIWLKNARKKRNLTQEEVASYIGVHLATYSNIERGERNPSLSVALKISEFFGVEVKKLRG